MIQVTFKKILLPTDGSKLANSVIPYTASLAQICQAEVVLLQVINSLEDERDFSIFPVPAVPISTVTKMAKDVFNRNKQEAQKQLERVRKNLNGYEIFDISTFVQEGLAEETIVKFAKKNQCDVIIMSTHGRSGLKRTILGSVTDQVIRHAPCPVLVIPPTKNKSHLSTQDFKTYKEKNVKGNL